MVDIVTIAGSPSAGSRSAALLDRVRREADAVGLTTSGIIVRDLDAQALLHGRYDSPALKPSLELVAGAAAVVVATPVYKATYSGVLKTFLDVLPQEALAGKVALPIASGAAPTHALALEYGLKPLLAALGARFILNGLYLLDAQMQLSDGAVRLDEATESRFIETVGELRRMIDIIKGSSSQ